MELHQTNQTTNDPQEVVISERHWEFANSLPDVAGYLAYLNARQNGSSHIWAANLAWKAIAR